MVTDFEYISACNCDIEGSNSEKCNVTTGQCDCKENIEGMKCRTCSIDNKYGPGCIGKFDPIFENFKFFP